jgi:hypothetical protein
MRAGDAKIQENNIISKFYKDNRAGSQKEENYKFG